MLLMKRCRKQVFHGSLNIFLAGKKSVLWTFDTLKYYRLMFLFLDLAKKAEFILEGRSVSCYHCELSSRGSVNLA